MVVITLLLPISVSAGLFSILRGNSNDTDLSPDKNIQNMALLVAVATPFGDISHIPEVEDNALVSNIGPTGIADSEVKKATSDQISIYVVRPGDTLSQIAEMFNVTVNTIKWGNDLSSNTLKVGDTLVILPVSGVRHTVVKGDTIASVAKKYNGDINEIMIYNEIKKGASLAIGSVVVIPDGEIATVSYSSSSSSSGSSSNEYKNYYIKPINGGRRSQGLHGHNAVDFAAPVGTPILASAGGEVIINRTSGWNGGYGVYLVIRHSNGTQTLYAHNSRNNVSVGDKVKQGDVIAFIGSTGKSTGSHVHFEIRGARNPF